MIAREGFTPDALSYAGEAGILISSGEDWARIVRWVK
jgi:hypothetical protein